MFRQVNIPVCAIGLMATTFHTLNADLRHGAEHVAVCVPQLPGTAVSTALVPVTSTLQHVSHIFGHDGCTGAAAEMGVTVLGSEMRTLWLYQAADCNAADIPLTLATRISCDEGKPIVVAQPDSAPVRYVPRS